MLRVAALELPARWNDRATVLRDVERLLATAPCDLAVLPEAALTGYVSPDFDFDLSLFAEPLDGPTGTALSALALAHRCHLAAPLVERDGDRCHNAVVVFGPDGARLAHYRKRHPWYPETWATPGESPPPVLDIRGAAVTVAICFDVHFLAADAAHELRAADVLLFPSAWVDEEGDARGELLPRLARTFDVAIVNANWGPGSPPVRGQGRSRILARDGISLAEAREPGRIDARLEVPTGYWQDP